MKHAQQVHVHTRYTDKLARRRSEVDDRLRGDAASGSAINEA